MFIMTFEQYNHQTPINVDEIYNIRSFLETRWGDSVLSQCIRATYFLSKVIGGEIAGGWVSENPLPNEKGGFLDKSGKWNFHYWIIKDDNIIDITADQFGEDAIIITDKNDKRYLNNGDMYNKKHDFRYTPHIVDEWIDDYSLSL